ncbi:MAG: DUF3313 domain-containing protein [Gammaproteobacteria bacterium]
MKNRLIAVTAVIALIQFIAGCASTYQGRSVERSGFLSDYSLLKPGKGDQALLVYWSPDAVETCGRYDKVLLDPVTIWTKGNSGASGVPEEDRQFLTDYLHRAVKNSLRNDYTLVAGPGPGVMRIRAAITEAEGSWVVLDTISSLHPGTLALSGLKQLATGTGSFVAETAVEVEIEDSLTRKPLVMAVDKRVGGKGWEKKFDSWGKVESAYDYWAEKMRTRLAECRNGQLRP